MSEYQYYEFQAIDRPLTGDEFEQVRALSGRARVSTTHFVNEYHYGSFRGDERKLMEQVYDAHLYFANWGLAAPDAAPAHHPAPRPQRRTVLRGRRLDLLDQERAPTARLLL